MRIEITRRSLVVGVVGAGIAAPLVGRPGEQGLDHRRRRAFETLVEAVYGRQAVAARHGQSSAADRLAQVYDAALPARRREIDGVLDELVAARLAHRTTAERRAVISGWAAAGGDRRATAARALALAGAAFGPTDRPLAAVI